MFQERKHPASHSWNRSHWTAQEDEILLQHAMKRGTKVWWELKTNGTLPGRDNKACCNRFLFIRRRFLEKRPFLEGSSRGSDQGSSRVVITSRQGPLVMGSLTLDQCDQLFGYPTSDHQGSWNVQSGIGKKRAKTPDLCDSRGGVEIRNAWSETDIAQEDGGYELEQKSRRTCNQDRCVENQWLEFQRELIQAGEPSPSSMNLQGGSLQGMEARGTAPWVPQSLSGTDAERSGSRISCDIWTGASTTSEWGVLGAGAQGGEGVLRPGSAQQVQDGVYKEHTWLQEHCESTPGLIYGYRQDPPTSSSSAQASGDLESHEGGHQTLVLGGTSQDFWTKEGESEDYRNATPFMALMQKAIPLLDSFDLHMAGV